MTYTRCIMYILIHSVVHIAQITTRSSYRTLHGIMHESVLGECSCSAIWTTPCINIFIVYLHPKCPGSHCVQLSRQDITQVIHLQEQTILSLLNERRLIIVVSNMKCHITQFDLHNALCAIWNAISHTWTFHNAHHKFHNILWKIKHQCDYCTGIW